VNRGIEARDTNMIAMAPAGTTVVPGDSRFEWLVQSCKSAAEGG
jgi:hypothetical protein